jgi:gliding motility-associated-like protein
MNSFDKIIKQKLEQFEVPFNEAHWAEMDGKLNAIRAVKIRNMLLICSTVIAIIAASSYSYFSDNTVASKIHTISANHLIENVSKTTEAKPSKEMSPPKKEAIANSEGQSENNTSKQTTSTLQVKNDKLSILKDNKKQIGTDTNLQKNKPTILKKINAEFIVYNNQVCLGDEITFESLENNLPVSYTWNFGDGTISNEKNPSHTYQYSKIYDVSLTLVNKQTGEKKTSTQHNVVTILENPKGNFIFAETSLEQKNNKLKYPYTTFSINDIRKEHSYSWNYGNGESATTSFGKTIYKQSGEYTTTLTVKNNTTGCSTIQKQKILIQNGFDLFAPNAFTPNNNRENETFIPKALLGWNIEFEMLIFNPFGKTIFTTSDKNEPWNGKVNNIGQLLEEGCYLWQVTTFDIENKPHHHHGKITLVK